eukprot:scaffold23707_cov49-Phaeocystis_antarctica.AAC.1
MLSEVLRQQAQAEGLTLRVAENKTGYFGVHLNHKSSEPKPYQAQMKHGGKKVSLGSFATAEEAALCVARSPEGQAAAQKAAAAPPPLTSEEALQQAQAEGLTLLKAKNKTGYFGVSFTHPGRRKPYQAQVWRGNKIGYLGSFATAEEAALCVARSPEGRAAAGRAAPADSQGTCPAAMAPGAEPVVKVEALLLLLDDDLDLDECIGRHGRDNARLVSEDEEGSDDRPKRQRKK